MNLSYFIFITLFRIYIYILAFKNILIWGVKQEQTKYDIFNKSILIM